MDAETARLLREVRASLDGVRDALVTVRENRERITRLERMVWTLWLTSLGTLAFVVVLAGR